jgi:TPR repeat protein
MGFKKTSEGRVFFKNADNDDLPVTSINTPSESLVSKDSAQSQILLLLKTLNEKLQESRDDNAMMKKSLDIYKAKIEALEDRTLAQQTDYIDLEQKVSEKQNEVNKKATRVENNLNSTLKQLETARELVKALEEKSEKHDDTLEAIKDDIQTKIDARAQEAEEIAKTQERLLKKQKILEARQKEHNEKMASTANAHVSLTKRISQTETRQDALDNKIEDATSEYLKLDRKIDKVIEDRNRLLRKIERIEGAVIETRDALNAKAMVLLTDQGAVAGVNLPDHMTHAALSNEPMVLKRRLEEEAMMPWWRRPIQIHTASLFLLLMVVMLLGWIMAAANSPVREGLLNRDAGQPPTISLGSSATSQSQFYSEQELSQNDLYDAPVTEAYENTDYSFDQDKEPDFALSYNEEPEDIIPAAGSIDNTDQAASERNYGDQSTDAAHGITIHKGYSDPVQIKKETEEQLDISNDAQMLSAMETDPERVAVALNNIEPGNLNEENIQARINTPVTSTPSLPEKIITPQRVVDEEYKSSLLRRIKPDQSLTDVAKKIEKQAFEGVPEAQHDMGAIYIAGRGAVKQNLERAVFWFQEASNNGVANAKYNLGVLYHQGLGVAASLSKAISLYKDAAEMGHPEAQYNLGIANIEGIGVPYNPGNAAQYFEKAAEQGVVEAAYNLGLIYENGLLGEAQPDIALTWYKYASDAGSPEAKSAMQQLATSLGVGLEDITRIIENVKRSHTSFANAQDKSSLIASTQSELMRRGLYPGPVDGMLGPMTRSAIENFQKTANLLVDGEPSIELLQYLKASTNYSQYQ